MRPGTEMFLNADGRLTETGLISRLCAFPDRLAVMGGLLLREREGKEGREGKGA